VGKGRPSVEAPRFMEGSGSVYLMNKGTAILVGRSRDRSPVVSLGVFSVTSDNSMSPGLTQPLKMSTRIPLGVKTAGAYD
jgi:hypothetical protein